MSKPSRFKVGQKVGFKSIKPYTCSSKPVEKIKGIISKIDSNAMHIDIINCPSSFIKGELYFFRDVDYENIIIKSWWRFWK